MYNSINARSRSTIVSCALRASVAFVALAAASSASSAGPILSMNQLPGPGVQVAVRVRNLGAAQAAGYQAFLEFDNTSISFVSGAYVTTAYGLPVINPITASGNQINLAAGVSPFLGQTPTSADSDVAILTFASTGTGCRGFVRVRPGTNPPTRVTDSAALAILPLSIANSWPVCRADINNSGAVTVQDIFDFLALWFANDCRADFNNAGGVGVQDIFDFLAAWFGAC